MDEAKEPYLNVAYFGPPVPHQQSNHRHSLRRWRCRNPCRILRILFTAIVVIVVVLGIMVLIMWILLHPSKLKFHIENASLTRFNLTEGRTLDYNLKLNMSVKNPNKRFGIYYDKLEAAAYYDRKRFGHAALPSFYQRHHNTTFLHPAFDGQSNIAPGTSGVADFNSDKSDGFFDINIKINARIRFKIGSIKIRYNPKYDCDLRLPLAASSDGNTTKFTKTECEIHFYRK